MMGNVRILSLCSAIFFALSVFSLPVLAIEDEDGQYPTPDGKKEDINRMPAGKKIGKLDIDIMASVAYGYDANVNLNRYDKDGSIFTENTLGLYGTYPVSEIFTLRGNYDISLVKYFKFSDPDLLNNILGLGLDAEIAEGFLWSVDYKADFVDFPRDKFSKYTMNELEAALTQDITDWLYQRISYQFSHRYYPEWDTKNSQGNDMTRKREDYRNGLAHEFGVYLGDRTFIKSENMAYYNDSNELFLDFYDYRAFKTKASIAHLITDKFYESVSFAYQYKAYDKRGISDSHIDQRDHLFICGVSVFYDVTPSVAIGTSVDFRKNYSNENDQAYEDCIMSSGVYCAF